MMNYVDEKKELTISKKKKATVKISITLACLKLRLPAGILPLFRARQINNRVFCFMRPIYLCAIMGARFAGLRLVIKKGQEFVLIKWLSKIHINSGGRTMFHFKVPSIKPSTPAGRDIMWGEREEKKIDKEDNSIKALSIHAHAHIHTRIHLMTFTIWFVQLPFLFGVLFAVACLFLFLLPTLTGKNRVDNMHICWCIRLVWLCANI